MGDNLMAESIPDISGKNIQNMIFTVRGKTQY
jgi:hypothetical protein